MQLTRYTPLCRDSMRWSDIHRNLAQVVGLSVNDNPLISLLLTLETRMTARVEQ
jgi:hypothetical protein